MKAMAIKKTARPEILTTLVPLLAIGLVSLLFMNGCAPDSEPSAGTPREKIAFSPQAHPGTGGIDPELLARYQAVRKEKGVAYKPRTRHLDASGEARFANRLFLESSPYLLQHAHNPVNWYPWGDEAFEAARQKNRPVLLSIGYSTCHWCHVMEEESFEDLEIAAFLNAHYIAVKVDREQRPDVDAIYMSAVQAITGRGGWPMTVWLTPDRKPFFGGTYYPARDGDRGARMGFLTLLQKVREGYDQKPEAIRQAGTQLADVIQRMLAPQKGGRPPLEPVLHNAVNFQKTRYDGTNGGVAGAPKFPSTMPVRLLFRYYRRTGDETALEMARHTLEKMAAGGLYDQAGGGFHRYATDNRWLVPHFEKMLYDNALLVMAYLEGFQVTGSPLFEQVVVETLDYVKRDMTAPEGGFYTATDADSLTPTGETEEGYYFTWTPRELEAALGEKDAVVAARYFDVTAAGNFEGRNILNRKDPAATVAADLGVSTKILDHKIALAKPRLYAYRNRRPAPLRDEKIITAWNGLMISAFARSGLLLDRPDYVLTARKAARFVLEKLYHNNRLQRSYTNGRAGQRAFLDDYAFFSAALLDLFEADPDPFWLETVLALDKSLADYYEDRTGGGFFMTANDHESLIAREKPGYDGALPSGNAVAVMNLLRLAEFTTNDDYRQRAARATAAFAAIFDRNPQALSEMLLALDFSLDATREIVIVTPRAKPLANGPFLAAFRDTYLPNRVLIRVTEGPAADELARHLPIVQGKTTQQGKTVAYVCAKGVCQLPSLTVAEFKRQIQPVKKIPPLN
jgi:uncharacterized protein YyaL (SSP411 family)